MGPKLSTKKERFKKQDCESWGMAKKRGKVPKKALKQSKSRKTTRKSPATTAHKAKAHGAAHAGIGTEATREPQAMGMDTGAAMPQAPMAPTAQQPASALASGKLELDVGPNMTHHVLPKMIGMWQTVAIVIVAIAVLGMLLSLFVFGKFFEIFLRAFG